VVLHRKAPVQCFRLVRVFTVVKIHCDLTTFIDAKFKGDPLADVNIKQFFTYDVKQIYREFTPIRNYDHFSGGN